MDLQVLWFCIVALFFGGYFLLEGFDFGVGLLLPILPRNEEERDVMFRTIGPVWDGNEVWLVVAGAAMFAAFPAWYATMFSGFYIALLLLLVFLIVRVLSFEWRERHHDSRWRRPLDMAEHGRRASAHRSSGASPSRTCSTACRSTRTATSPAASGTSSTSYTLLGGVAVAAAVRVPRRDLPDAAHDRRAVPAGGRGGRPALDRGGRCRRRLPDLDGRGRGRQERQGRLPARAPGRARDRRAARRGRRRPPGPQRLGVRAHRGRSVFSSWPRSSPASIRA